MNSYRKKEAKRTMRTFSPMQNGVYGYAKRITAREISHDGNENPATSIGGSFGVRNCNGQRDK